MVHIRNGPFSRGTVVLYDSLVRCQLLLSPTNTTRPRRIGLRDGISVVLPIMNEILDVSFAFIIVLSRTMGLVDVLWVNIWL